MEDNGVFENVTIPKKTYDSILEKLANPIHIEVPFKKEGEPWHPDPDYWGTSEWKAPTASEKQIGGNHYKEMAIQPSEYITKNGIGWYEGNAIKYISRYKQKGGKKDIEKAIHYLELLLESLE